MKFAKKTQFEFHSMGKFYRISVSQQSAVKLRKQSKHNERIEFFYILQQRKK